MNSRSIFASVILASTLVTLVGCSPAEPKTPSDFILGTWSCEQSRGDAEGVGTVTLTVTEDTATFTQEGGELKLGYSLVADTLEGEVTSAPGELADSAPGQNGTVTGVPVALPEPGEKVQVVLENSYGSPLPVTLFRDENNTLFLENVSVGALFSVSEGELWECSK